MFKSQILIDLYVLKELKLSFVSHLENIMLLSINRIWSCNMLWYYIWFGLIRFAGSMYLFAFQILYFVNSNCTNLKGLMKVCLWDFISAFVLHLSQINDLKNLSQGSLNLSFLDTIFKHISAVILKNEKQLSLINLKAKCFKW